MKLPKEIIQQMLNKAGLSLTSPSLVDRLVDDILKVTGARLGVNTLKRLMGIYDDERTPHRYTLEVVAHYLGASSYDALLKQGKGGNSQFMTDVDYEVISSSLTVGTIITFTYQPDREVVLRYEGEEKFTVTSSVNSKLQKDDVCKIAHMKNGQPLYASKVVRNGKDLGRFIGGEEYGIQITEIEIN